MTFYRDATITIDGHTFESVGSVEYEPDYGLDVRTILEPVQVEVSCEVPIDASALERFFPCEPYGASAATLAKRVRYGGRKGRSALRRLRARAIPIEMHSGGPWPSTLRGKAVVLDEEKLFVEMRGPTPQTRAAPEDK